MADTTTTTKTAGLLLADGTRLVQDNIAIATTDTAGIVKPDGNTISIDANGTISTNVDILDDISFVTRYPITGMGIETSPISISYSTGLTVANNALCIDNNYSGFLSYYTKTYIDANFARVESIPAKYVLPTATDKRLGGVKVGDGLYVDGEGTISVSIDIDSLRYTLPAATSAVLGGIKIGAGLSITADGVVSVDTIDTPTVIAVKPVDNKLTIETDRVPALLKVDNKTYTIDTEDYILSGNEVTIDITSALCLWNMSSISDSTNVYVYFF